MDLFRATCDFNDRDFLYAEGRDDGAAILISAVQDGETSDVMLSAQDAEALRDWLNEFLEARV